MQPVASPGLPVKPETRKTRVPGPSGPARVRSAYSYTRADGRTVHVKEHAVHAPGERCRNLERKVLSVVVGGSNLHGRCYAYEKTKRRWIAGKWGVAPGERSVGRKERELVKRGKLVRERIKPGVTLYGIYYEFGGVWVRVRRRQEQRAIDRWKRKNAMRKPSPPPVERPALPPVTRPPVERSDPAGLFLTDEQLALNAESAAAVLAMLEQRGPPK